MNLNDIKNLKYTTESLYKFSSILNFYTIVKIKSVMFFTPKIRHILTFFKKPLDHEVTIYIVN